MQDLETNPDFRQWVADCLSLNLDPENPNLEMGEYTHQLSNQPWFENWIKKKERIGEPDKINGYDDGEQYDETHSS